MGKKIFKNRFLFLATILIIISTSIFLKYENIENLRTFLDADFQQRVLKVSDLSVIETSIQDATGFLPKNASAEEKIIALNTWIYRNLLYGDPQKVSMNTKDIIRNGQAACSLRSHLMLDMLNYMGYEARLVNMWNIPIQIGHTALEVKYAGTWHFFDPTFGIFFTDNSDQNNNILDFKGGNVLGFLEIRKLRNLVNKKYSIWIPKVSRRCQADQPFLKYLTTQTINDLVKETSSKFFINECNQRKMLDIGSYTSQETVGGPLTEESKYFLPVQIDMLNRKIYTLGKLDKSHKDITFIEKLDANNVNQKPGFSQFIGSTYISHQMSPVNYGYDLTLKNLRLNRIYNLVIDFYGQSKPKFNIIVNSLDSNLKITKKSEYTINDNSKNITFKFRAISKTMKIRIDHPYTPQDKFIIFTDKLKIQLLRRTFRR